MQLLNEKTAAALQQIMDDEVSRGNECGCQLAIYQHGKLAVNLSAGHTTPSQEKKVNEDTLFPVFSVGKGIMATAFHRLVEKGIIDYETRVADLWPEFGCNGKEDILVWHILTHRGALSALPEPADPAELADWELMCRRIAAMTPAWKPGTKCQYHPITYAWLLGEVARRADGRPFAQIINDEVIAPLKLDLFFGTTTEADLRLAPIDASSFPDNRTWHTEFIGNDAIRHGFIPSANGIAGAKAIARHYAALVGEVDGVRLLTPKTVGNAASLHRWENDPIPPSGTWERFGLGYALHGSEGELGTLFGHGGAAGAEGFADRKNQIALGLTRNKVRPSHPVYTLRDRISAVLGYLPRHW